MHGIVNFKKLPVSTQSQLLVLQKPERRRTHQDVMALLPSLSESKYFMDRKDVIDASTMEKILLKATLLSVEKGRTVVKEGAEGDYFYVILHGQCGVYRKTQEYRNF